MTSRERRRPCLARCASGAALAVFCAVVTGASPVGAFGPSGSCWPAQETVRSVRYAQHRRKPEACGKRKSFTTLLTSSSRDDTHMLGTGWSPNSESGFHHPKSKLSAATLSEIPTFGFPRDEDGADTPFRIVQENLQSSVGGDDVKNMLSAALLITGNTVGASILCLPEFVAGPGMQVSSSLLMGIFGVNLISGLLIAEVAIKQYETSRGDVPSSFKDFADATLQNPAAGNSIASASVFTNWCVLAYSLIQAGDVASTFTSGLGIDSTIGAAGVAAALTALVGSQTNEALSRVASVACAVLFASFAGMLLPGLANVHDPIGTFFAPGTATNVFDSASNAAPIFLSTMVYQNIVPSITKLLNYDRSRSAIAIFLGSLIPTIMYLSFSFAVLGGGIDSSVASGGPFLTAFSVASLAGSSIACIMSIAEEFDSILSTAFPPSSPTTRDSSEVNIEPAGQTFSLLSVLLAVAPPLLAGVIFSGGESFSEALKYSGGYGVPALYGLLPVALAMAQRKAEQGPEENITTTQERSLVPGGLASLSLLGIASGGFVGQEIMADMGTAFASASGCI